MATAALKVVPTSTAVVIPEVPKISKIGVWKTRDGQYHETVESIREALTQQAIADFIAANNITDMKKLPLLLAQHMSVITKRVDDAY